MPFNKKIKRFGRKNVQPIIKSDIFVSLYAIAPFDYPARCYNNYIGFITLKFAANKFVTNPQIQYTYSIQSGSRKQQAVYNYASP